MTESNQPKETDSTNESREQELETQLKRALADYANLKKRLEKEKSEMIRFSNELLLMQLVAILDGLEMTVREFKNLLHQAGFERVDVNQGDTFNPQIMEAIDKDQSGDKVVEVYAPAYKLHDKIIRAAQVKLGENKSNHPPSHNASSSV